MDIETMRQHNPDIITNPEAVSEVFSYGVHPTIESIMVRVNQSLVEKPVQGLITAIPFGSAISKWALRRTLGITPEVCDIELGIVVDSRGFPNHPLSTRRNIYSALEARFKWRSADGLPFDLNQAAIFDLNPVSLAEMLDYYAEEKLEPTEVEELSVVLPFLANDDDLNRRALSSLDQVVSLVNQQKPGRYTLSGILTDGFYALTNPYFDKHCIPQHVHLDVEKQRYRDAAGVIMQSARQVAEQKAADVIAKYG